ncbi:MAG TPA: branched-chain amino acid ABC transporter permease [Polyangiaceae bacterium]|nr:branched-chain amino acid ABC transporter permease [Polyangiaceae bacterium]
MTRIDARSATLAAVACVALATAALLDESALSVYVLLALTASVTVGVSLLMGHAGQVSLGHGAFYASGAYAAGILATHGFPSWLGLLVAPIAAASIAVVVGIPLLLLRGHHLAFATLALHLIFLSIISELSITGGDVGLQGIPRLSLAGVALTSVRSYAYVSWFALFLVVVVARNILRSRPGRALRALASSEVAAASSGVAVGYYKLAVFALSACFAGLAGGIYAFYMGYLAPGSFPVMLSIEYIVMAAVGGLGKVSGALAGSAVVFLLVHGLSRVATSSGMPGSAPVILSYAVYAVLLVSAVLFLPGGLISFIGKAWARARRGFNAKDVPVASQGPARADSDPEGVPSNHGSFS